MSTLGTRRIKGGIILLVNLRSPLRSWTRGFFSGLGPAPARARVQAGRHYGRRGACPCSVDGSGKPLDERVRLGDQGRLQHLNGTLTGGLHSIDWAVVAAGLGRLMTLSVLTGRILLAASVTGFRCCKTKDRPTCPLRAKATFGDIS